MEIKIVTKETFSLEEAKPLLADLIMRVNQDYMVTYASVTDEFGKPPLSSTVVHVKDCSKEVCAFEG